MVWNKTKRLPGRPVVGQMFQLPKQLKELVDYYCDEVGISTASYIQSLIENHLAYESRHGYDDLTEHVDDWTYYEKRAKYKPIQPPSKRPLHPGVVEQIIRLSQEGWTNPAISEELGVSISSVTK